VEPAGPSPAERGDRRLDQLVAVGGGAASTAWAQLLADAFDRPVRRLALPEAAAAGAAFQARWVVDGVAPPDPQAVDILEPDPLAIDALAVAAERAARARTTMGVPPPEVVSLRAAEPAIPLEGSTPR